jgi:predicted methyltransferase
MRSPLILAAALAACASSQKPAPTEADTRARAQSIVDAPDRTPNDRKLDAGRKPVETLVFLHLQPGMHVAELGAGGGYTTELLARAVAPGGVVYAQNSEEMIKAFLQKSWPERLARPVMKDVVRADRPFDDPFPPEGKDLDAVLINVLYHDVAYSNVDRDRMNKAIFAALKAGGTYTVIDSSARPGTGVSDVKTLHRIDEQVVREEVLRAGFKLQTEGSFLRNPDDPRDWNSSPVAAGERRGTSDRFALQFVKP